MESLTYQTEPIVTLATNTFIDIPTILQFDDTPLVSIIKEEQLKATTKIPVYHSDGTHLAEIVGTRFYKTEAGKFANIEIRKEPTKSLSVNSLTFRSC